MLSNTQSLVGFAFVLAIIIVDGLILVEEQGDSETMVWVDGGTFTMGSDRGLQDEAPARPVEISGFWIDKYEVTNSQFKQFVDATAYATGAERFGDSMVFQSPDCAQSVRACAAELVAVG
jgi:formylglycine-generating enzyme required for sulfatase activity